MVKESGKAGAPGLKPVTIVLGLDSFTKTPVPIFVLHVPNPSAAGWTVAQERGYVEQSEQTHKGTAHEP